MIFKPLLFKTTEDSFKNHGIQKVQDEKNTLTVIVDNNIKLSFFKYKYLLLKPLISEPNISLASVEDIACMKLSAIVSRSTQKDYVDLYFILQTHRLSELLAMCIKKIPTLDTNLIIKSLIYFDDIIEESIVFKNDNYVTFDEMKKFMFKTVKEYLV